MKKYFIQTDKGQEGPFTIEELTFKGLTYKTMIWFEGISAWTEAKFIPELKDIVTPVPPPFEGKKNNMTNEINKKPENKLNQNPMENTTTKNYKTPFIISVIIIFILITFMILPKGSSSTVMPSKIDKTQFAGVWTIDHESDNFELNPDSGTYNFYLHGSEMHIKGHWDIIELNLNNEKTTLLVLKNEIPTTGNASYPERGYFKFYFYSIDKIINKQITLTDLSGETTVRRNETNIMKLK